MERPRFWERMRRLTQRQPTNRVPDADKIAGDRGDASSTAGQKGRLRWSRRFLPSEARNLDASRRQFAFLWGRVSVLAASRTQSLYKARSLRQLGPDSRPPFLLV
jgi:hypothetical protein